MTRGQDAKAALAQSRGDLATANTRLGNDRAFYADVCQRFSSNPRCR